MPLNLSLRQATPADSEFCYEVKKAAHRENIVRIYGPWDEDFQRHFHERQWHPEGVCIIVSAGADAGRVWLKRLPAEMSVNGLYILPEHQRKGIGRELLTQVQRECAETGNTIRLRVMKVNTATEFYTKLGFVVVGQNKTHWKMEWRATPGEPTGLTV